MKILLVEDDEFKAADLGAIILEVYRDACIERAMSVTAALRWLSTQKFDVVLLDMSLPTFDMSGPGGGGSPQGQGGIEVLRLARRLHHISPFIIVTQYPDIELEGRSLRLADAPQILSKMLGISIKSCILYELDDDSWRRELRIVLNTRR
jgi:CheY-like chemotaxis protein